MANPIVHFEIHVADPERAMAFYRGALGWEFTFIEVMDYTLVFPMGEVTNGPAAVGINGGMVIRKGPTPSASSEPNAFVCTVSVDDIDAVLARIEDLGGTIEMGATPVPDIGTIAYVRDIDGNLFGLLQPEMSTSE